MDQVNANGIGKVSKVLLAVAVLILIASTIFLIKVMIDLSEKRQRASETRMLGNRAVVLAERANALSKAVTIEHSLALLDKRNNRGEDLELLEAIQQGVDEIFSTLVTTIELIEEDQLELAADGLLIAEEALQGFEKSYNQHFNKKYVMNPKARTKCGLFLPLSFT